MRPVQSNSSAVGNFSSNRPSGYATTVTSAAGAPYERLGSSGVWPGSNLPSSSSFVSRTSSSGSVIRAGSDYPFAPKVNSSLSTMSSLPYQPQSANKMGEELMSQLSMSRQEVKGDIVAVQPSLSDSLSRMSDDQIWRLHDSLSHSHKARVFERAYVAHNRNGDAADSGIPSLGNANGTFGSN